METLTLLTASLLLLATPGPTNTLLATSGVAVGLKRSLPLLAAALAGYVIAIAVLRSIIGPLAAQSPAFQTMLSAAVATYLFYLAAQLWRHSAPFEGDRDPVTWPRVLTTTLLNPKSIIFAFVLVPVGKQGPALLPWYAGLASLILLTGTAWIAIGAALNGRSRAGVAPQLSYRAGAIALGVFASAVSARTLGLV